MRVYLNFLSYFATIKRKGCHMIDTEQFNQRIELINNWNMRDIAYRLVKREGLKEQEVQEAIIEFKKYMIIHLVTGKTIAMSSDIVDLVWHQFILFTKEYHEFCFSVFDEYIHHSPATDTKKPKQVHLENLLSGYASLFGNLPKIWKKELSRIDCDCQSE